MTDQKKLDPAEGVKANSRFLRGEIAEELAGDSDHFTKPNAGLLKAHGMYQQDDRDVRQSRRAEGVAGKEFIFMVRTKLPGGMLTSEQLLAELDLCDELGDTTLRITSRQGLQLHGVLKRDLHRVVARINEVRMTTLGACGDVGRNVMCCPAPYSGEIHREVQRLATEIGKLVAPQSGAYREIWLRDLENGEKELVGGGAEESEPLYGATYLPRKFKIAIGFPHDNCVDLYTHDLGLMAIVKDERILGYNVVVGGGQGVTPALKITFPALAKRMAFVSPEQVVDVCKAIIGVQRDFGNRSNRKQARMKYLIHDWGLPRFRAKVEEYFGAALADPHEDDVHGFDDHMGWDQQGDGRWFYGLNVENGRIADNDNARLKSALREICQRFRPGIRLTSHQSILLTDIEEANKADLESMLRDRGVLLSHEISPVRRYSMACVAWPTCGLSITESERALPGVIDLIEAELAKYGLSNEIFTVRMTGCPNGCARPYNPDIGLVGKAKDKYTVLIGGRLLGDRLNFVYRDLVPTQELAPTLSPLFAYFKQERLDGETFGDFCDRKGKEELLAWAEDFRTAT